MSSSLPYYRQELTKRIALFVMAPLLLLIIIMMVKVYYQNVSRAQQVIEEHIRASASELEKELQSLAFAASNLASLKPISEVPVNILYTQSSVLALQQYIEREPLVEGAFILDQSDFVIEGYPLSTLRIDSQRLQSYTTQLMQQNYTESSTSTIWIRRDVLNDFRNSGTTAPAELLLATPLFAETSSVINPYEVTGVLYFLVDLAVLFETISLQDSNYGRYFFRLIQGGESLYVHDFLDVGKTLDSQFEIETVFLLDGKQADFALLVSHDKSFYDQYFWEMSLIEILPLLILLPLMYWLMQGFILRLNKPLQETIELCRSFASGQYQVQPKTQEFREFDELFKRMNAMASVISEQIKSLEQAKKSAEHSEQIKSQFLANMSHEIRTPMNGVLGMLQLMKAENLTKEQVKKIEIAAQSAENLLTIINDILDFSKIEAKKIELEMLPCDIVALIENQIKALELQANQRGNRLTFENPQNDPGCYRTDPVRLSQILVNLISNGIKFTADGEVVVTFSGHEQEGFVISVKDSGIGIAKDKQENLFQPFQQEDNSTTRRYGGTGLGLTICSSLCELMNGKLTVESDKGQGATFTMHIPAEPCRQEDLPQENEETNFTLSLSKYRVLIAEDNEINQEVIRALLKPTKAIIGFANNGEEAVNKIPIMQPDLILMDVHMPVMDGVEATKAIRQQGYDKPILMQTANVMSEDVALYLEAGAQDVIAKPIVKEQLMSTIARWIE